LGLYCVMGTCAVTMAGSPCTSSQGCTSEEGNFQFACVNNTCVDQYTAGDRCSSSDQCLGSMICYEGVCQGLPLGANCTYVLGECAFGMWCYNSSCVPQSALSQPCEGPFASCQLGSFCNGNHICEQYFQAGEGAVCDGPMNCQSGLVCVYQREVGVGTCQEVNLFAPCTSQQQCQFSNCTCDPITGENICVVDDFGDLNLCGQQEQANIQCHVDNNCPVLGDYRDGTCSSMLCQETMIAYSECLCGIVAPELANCGYFPYCPDDGSSEDMPPWKKALIIAGCILTAGALATTIVCAVVWYNKRQKYHRHRLLSGIEERRSLIRPDSTGLRSSGHFGQAAAGDDDDDDVDEDYEEDEKSYNNNGGFDRSSIR